MNSRLWEVCKDPLFMLRFLEAEILLSERKCRLAMLTMCRHFQHRFTDPCYIRLVNAVEEAMEAGKPMPRAKALTNDSIVATAVGCVASPDAMDAIIAMCFNCRNYRLLDFSAIADVFRNIWWNPYKVNPFQGTNPSHTSIAMADEAYQVRATNGVMNRDVLAILADSLEDDGIESPVIRQHLTRVKPHYRGDWAIDTILNKGN